MSKNINLGQGILIIALAIIGIGLLANFFGCRTSYGGCEGNMAGILLIPFIGIVMLLAIVSAISKPKDKIKSLPNSRFTVIGWIIIVGISLTFLYLFGTQ